MAKRGGKAASRRSRQRPVRRPAPPSRPAASGATATTTLEPPATAPGADRRAEAASPERRPSAAPPGPAYGSSLLSERARAEYHYVVRDLRNIGVLTAIMAAMLAAAFVLFRVVGLGT